ncbi:hypothetical protein EXIGLDRAFT_473379 [Exidia glandulosa HHB12029]|uniref:Uncharacterized protein n=1 Tax=Exidia glandulosa HHB12029 TaxID=1314781 RepID=A0A165JYA3_EXIGL|nr:hypothetical protein EXIGLDRAFT_473379 [Exidia glandulosa HHB12029]
MAIFAEFHSEQSDFGSMFSSILRVIRLDQLIYIPYRSIREYCLLSRASLPLNRAVTFVRR